MRGGQAAWAPSLPPPPPGSGLLVPGAATPLTAPPPCLPSPTPWPGTGLGRIYGAGPCGEDPGINLSLFRSVIYIYCT